MGSDVASGTERSEYSVPKMDCPSEERTIKMALDDASAVRGVSFDLPRRRVAVWHAVGAARDVTERLERLGMGAEWVETRATEESAVPVAQDADEARTLKVLLGINAVMFVAELTAGLLVQSTALIADSIDMFADAAVYGLSLYVVGRAKKHKLRAAHLSGLLQLLLAIGALLEVARRFVMGSDPDPGWMMAVAFVALAANVTCLVLISRHREGGAHMKASYIFSANDVIANVGVIAAGLLVALTGTRYPDLVVGALVAGVVLSGAVRILRLR